MQNADWGDRRHPRRWEAETWDAGFWMPDCSEISMGRFDVLTGLLNRHGLLAAADSVFDKTNPGIPATVLFADLNQFKAVNDRYGHGVGDRVMAEFAQIFSESAEMGVCGRWGSGEFVAILPQRDEAAIRRIFMRIESRTEAWSNSNGLPMAVSLGVSHAPRDGHDL
jgi:diguanylate cyclase (GGDEF)-like protein